MDCKKCKQKECGCSRNSFLETPPPCTALECENANPCGEVFSTDCIIYTGAPIESKGILTGDTLTVVIQKLSV